MIEADPGQIYTASVEGAPAGAPMGVRVEDGSGNVITPRQTDDVVELVAGVYAIDSLVAPEAAATYIVIWDNGDVPLGPEDFATEELKVSGIRPTLIGGGGGVLPFRSTGSLLKQGGAVALVGLAVSVWPLPGARQTATGEAYDWSGQAEIGASDEIVGQPNRTLLVEGRRMKVIAAQRHDFLPHVQLELREIRQGG